MNLFPVVNFAVDGAGGDAGGNGGGDGGQQQQQQGGAGGDGGQQQQQAAQWKAPDGLPSHLAGKTADETVGNLWKAYEGARIAIGEKGTVPKEPKAYEFSFSDKAKPILSNPEADGKVLDVVKGALHKHGITDKQAGFVNDLVEGFVDAGLIPKAIDPNETWKSMAPPDFKGSDIEKIAEGQKAVKEAKLFIDGLKGQSGFTEGMSNELMLLTGSAEGMQTLKWIMGQGTQKTVQAGGGDGGQGLSRDQVNARRNDPRNQYGNSKYDPAFAQETERLYKVLFPG